MAFSTHFALPRATSRAIQNPIIAPSRPTHQCQLKLSFPFHLNNHKGNLRARRAPLPLRVLCMRESRAAVVTKDSWENLILKSDTPVLVEFYASWCGPCRMVHRVIDEIAGDYAGRLKCFMLNTDNDLPVAEDYEIKAVPVVLMFKNGMKRESVVGTMPKEFYIAAIERVLES